MSNFLEEYNQTPSLKLIDQQWQTAYQKNLHHTVMLYADIALQKRKQLSIGKFPDDTELYTAISVSGYYTNNKYDQELAEKAASTLCIEKLIDSKYRDLARKNQLFYIRQLDELVGPVEIKKFYYDFEYNANNPSILNWNNRLWMIQRTVNYTIDSNGRYNTGINDPIHTKNYLVELNDDLSVMKYQLIKEPESWPSPVYNLVLGFEDCRLFVVNNELYCISTNRDQHPEGLCQIALAKINPSTAEMFEARILSSPNTNEHQKNWMPFSHGDKLKFVYFCDPTTVIDDTGNILKQFVCPIAADNFRGGGQLINYNNGYLAIIHESVILDNGLRNYVHRFVTFDINGQLNGISSRFKFTEERIEFAAGLAWHPDGQRIIVSFGINDRESCLGILQSAQISKIIQPYTILQNFSQPIGPNI